MRLTLLMLITLTAISASAYGCAVILLHGSIALPLFHPWYGWLVWNAGPPALIGLALLGSFKLRQYRLMMAMRVSHAADPSAMLARGQVPVHHHALDKSGIERTCNALVLFGLITIPVWLAVPAPWLWIGTGIAFWLMIRWMLRAES